jgi:predicted NAD/FAD-dependent oxidoreductase
MAIAALLRAYAYEPIGTVYLGYPPALNLPFPMLGLNGGQSGRLGQWVFDRGLLGGADGVMGFVLSAEGAWDKRDNAALAAALHRELEKALGEKWPAPLWQQVIRERRATFSCRPNLLRPPIKTPLTGLWLAGDYVCADYPATLEGAVRSGVAAAREVLLAPSK